MDGELWSAYDEVGPACQRHAADSACNAHYDRPAVLAALGPVAGLRVLDAACGPGFYARELAGRGAQVAAFGASAVMAGLARVGPAGGGLPCRPGRCAALRGRGV